LKTFNIVIILSLSLFFSCRQKETEVIKFAGQTMGTSYHIKIITNAAQADEYENLHVEIDSVLRNVNMKMSTFIPESEISRFNAFQSTEPFEVSPEFVSVLKSALQINKDSNGAFDVTVGPLVNLWGFGKDEARDEPPAEEEIKKTLAYVGSRLLHIIDDTHIRKDNPHTEIDFSAIAKGYGVDAVGNYIFSRGLKNYIVEIGGEIAVRGKNGDKLWRVGIDRPQYNEQPGAELEEIIQLTNAGIATSGDYRNYFVAEDRVYSHEIDPVSGRSIITGVASATVIAPDCMNADGLATALMVMGAEKGIKMIENIANTEAFMILRDKEGFKEVMSSGFDKYLLKNEPN